MNTSTQFPRHAALRWTALLTVLMVVVFGCAQAVHVHSRSADEGTPNSPASHCASCVASHSIAVITHVSLAPVLTYQPESILTVEPQVLSRQRIFTSFTRPPPPAF